MTPKECERIYNEAYRAVYWTAISLLKNEADAEDVVQDTFVTLLESYDTLQDKTKVVPWLKKICANKCLNRLTRTKTTAVEQEFFDDAEFVPEDFLPESIVESAERRKIIMDIIEKSLSEDVRRTIILFYFDEMSTKEIAEAMGIPQGTVLWRLGFARKKIKKEVEKYERETDTKLYATALPFLALLFLKEAELVAVRPMPASLAELSASVSTSVAKAGNTNVSAKLVTETIKKGTGIVMKKILICVACIAMLGAVTVGAVIFMNREEEPRKARKNTGSVENQEKENGEDRPIESDTPSQIPVVLPPSQGLAIQDYYDDEDKYVPAGSAMVSGIGTCTDSNLIIPSVAPDGKAVAVIEDYSFEHCDSIETVVIPDSVTKIMNHAFAWCENLHSVTLPDSLRVLGSHAFASCHSLESITIPEGVEILSCYTFNACSSLKSVTLPNSLKKIYHHAFNYCTSLESIVIPQGVEAIGPGAFRNCTSLTSLIIPENTIVITGAFTGSGIQTINGIDAETWIALHCVDDYEED